MSVSGVGLGLRSAHIKDVLSAKAPVDWFELLTDNWLDASGLDGVLLDEFIEHYDVALHSIGMNIAGCDALDPDYFSSIKRLAKRCSASMISDHLCFSRVNGKPLHDLAPIPYNQETLQHVTGRIEHIQKFIGTTISIENISVYLDCLGSSMSEASFLNELAKTTGCRILLDINNLYVNEINIGRGAISFIDEICPDYISQYHLAGFNDKGEFLLDAHDHLIDNKVLDLYRYALKKIGIRPTLIEWDHNIPDFQRLMTEYVRVKEIYHQANKHHMKVGTFDNEKYYA